MARLIKTLNDVNETKAEVCLATQDYSSTQLFAVSCHTSLVPRPTSGRHFILPREVGLVFICTFLGYYPPIAGVQSDCLHGNINEYVTCCHLNLDTFNVTNRCCSYHGYSFAETLVGTCFFFETLRRNCSRPGVRKS